MVFILSKGFRFYIESWPEWDPNRRPGAYRDRTHVTAELSGRTIRCA